MQLHFETFRSSFRSWNSLLEEAADFASRLRPGQLHNIQHFSYGSEGLINVWYWHEQNQYARAGRVRYHPVRGFVLSTWRSLFADAAAFAAELAPGQLIGISQSSEQSGLVVVWYWEQADQG